MAAIWVIGAAVLSQALVAALPTTGTTHVSLHDLNVTWADAPSHHALSARAPISVPLRIMPLRHSITWGSQSSTGNGYRGPLEEFLSGVDVDFIGSGKHGSMVDSDNEGHSVSFLSEIKGYSLLSVAARPNVILVHAGTNDTDLNRDVATAPDRLAAIIDQLHEKCPDASVLVAQIIFSTDAAMQARTDRYSAAIANLVRHRQPHMSQLLTRADLADEKHPNDSGYRKMASAWRNAGKMGATGRKFEELGTIATGVGEPGSKVRFADVDGDGRADYLVLADDGSVRAWRNTGNLNKGSGRNFEKLGQIAAGVSGVAGSKVRMMDYDGDGLADYLILYDGGAVRGYRNTGSLGKDSSKRNFEELGTLAAGVAGVTGASVRFADLNGDGRVDYVSVSSVGAVDVWLNTGRSKAAGAVRFADLNGDGLDNFLFMSDSGAVDAWLNAGGGPQSWTSIGKIASGVNGAAPDTVVFADLDGDRLDDYIVIHSDGDGIAEYLVAWDGGAVEAWRNTGNLEKKPELPSWQKLGIIAAGVSNQGRVEFGDLNGDKKADYLNVDRETAAVRAYINQCAGSPPLNIVNPGTGGSKAAEWETVECTNPVVVDAAINPTKRWNGVFAPQAWDAAIKKWKDNPSPDGLSFSERASNFFHGRECMKCHDNSDRNGCSSFYQCHDTNHPAGYMILNSMTALNNMVWNFYAGIVWAEVDIVATVDSLQKTFAVLPDSPQKLKIILDIIGLGFALGAAPMWNIALKRTTYYAANGNELATLKDSANNVVANTITIVKDKQPTTPAAISSNLAQSVAEMCSIWYESIDAMHEKLFDGSDEFISTLDNLFKDGKLLQNGYDPLDAGEIQQVFSKALYALLIPQAWSLSKDVGGVVIDAQVPCGTIDPLGEEVSTEDSNASWVCYKDRMYFLLAARGKAEDGRSFLRWWQSMELDTQQIQLPPGPEGIGRREMGWADQGRTGAGRGQHVRGQRKPERWRAGQHHAVARVHRHAPGVERHRPGRRLPPDLHHPRGAQELEGCVRRVPDVGSLSVRLMKGSSRLRDRIRNQIEGIRVRQQKVLLIKRDWN
ncbi:uncharacterized protein B0T15DRAFT_572803 [Chaetomium strumarium]|uniref:SGNH hydrolase-type esterase domain-containing protein n=1 Tax=Chaetomium strumarium TaxID=1170767 RepID=A0AAJ0GYU5_9PEZI|nr:hypothetical protein B0T15DRAFT_572803 [Chaetomium strumarium]